LLFNRLYIHIIFYKLHVIVFSKCRAKPISAYFYD